MTPVRAKECAGDGFVQESQACAESEPLVSQPVW
jgi:hypothetical protein